MDKFFKTKIRKGKMLLEKSELIYMMSRYASGFIDLQGDSSTPLLDNNGNVMAYRRMEKGDVIQVGYMNGAWYTLNFQN